MPEYRVMNDGKAYIIQEKVGKDAWESVGEFDNIEGAKAMVRELRGGDRKSVV